MQRVTSHRVLLSLIVYSSGHFPEKNVFKCPASCYSLKETQFGQALLGPLSLSVVFIDLYFIC